MTFIALQNNLKQKKKIKTKNKTKQISLQRNNYEIFKCYQQYEESV